MRVLLVTRKSGQRARVAAINELKAFVVTCPVELREELRGHSTTALVKRCSAWRRCGDVETEATKTVMRIVARRIRDFDTQIADIDRQLKTLTEQTVPQLLAESGIGPFCAAQAQVSWSHQGRCRSEAAFARLAGVAPIEATSGQTNDKFRLNRGGDRQLNRHLRPRHPRLHRPIRRRRQVRTRRQTRPQTLHRPPHLETPRAPRLTHRSIAGTDQPKRLRGSCPAIPEV
jgi:transposase